MNMDTSGKGMTFLYSISPGKDKEEYCQRTPLRRRCAPPPPPNAARLEEGLMLVMKIDADLFLAARDHSVGFLNRKRGGEEKTGSGIKEEKRKANRTEPTNEPNG
jgi:hypothetical protein